MEDSAVRFTNKAELARAINERAACTGLKWKLRKGTQANAAKMTLEELNEMAKAVGLRVEYMCNVTPGCIEPAFVRIGEEKMPCKRCYKKLRNEKCHT